MVRERKRNLFKDHARRLGITYQSKHNGSDPLLGEPARKGPATREGWMKDGPGLVDDFEFWKFVSRRFRGGEIFDLT
jgi:hypothetical protein